MIPFAVVPYWLLFIKKKFFRREWGYLLLLGLLSLRVMVFDPAPANIKMVSNLAEIAILSVISSMAIPCLNMLPRSVCSGWRGALDCSPGSIFMF